MPLPILDPRGMTFFAIEQGDEVVELYLDYADPKSGANAGSRTWWRPDIRSLGGLTWRQLADLSEGREIAVDRIGRTGGEDAIASLQLRVQKQVA